MKTLRLGLLGGFLLGFGSAAFGQLVAWEITGANASVTNPQPAGLLAAHVTGGSLTIGSGVSASNTNDFFSANGFNTTSLAAAISGGDYLSFTITPAAGYALNISSVSFNTGVSTAVTNFNAALLSSVTGFNSAGALHSYSFATTTPPAQSITLSGTAALQSVTGALEFRLYGWRDSSGTSTFRLRTLSGNDLVVTGSVSAIPEPGTYAVLLGAAALAGAAIRRRRLAA
jgi:hypothetical protein